MCNVEPQIKTKNGKLDEFNVWQDALKLMNNPQKFIETLFNFTEKVELLQVPQMNFKSIRKTIKNPSFRPEHCEKVSQACAGLCQYVLNIVHFHDI